MCFPICSVWQHCERDDFINTLNLTDCIAFNFTRVQQHAQLWQESVDTDYTDTDTDCLFLIFSIAILLHAELLH